MSTPTQQAQTAIDRLRAAALALGRARAFEQQLEDERPLVKRAAIQRLMQQPNDLTGKAHSASSAEAIVEADPVYSEHRKMQRDAVLATQMAFGEYEAAKLEARLAVEMVMVDHE